MAQRKIPLRPLCLICHVHGGMRHTSSPGLSDEYLTPVVHACTPTVQPCAQKKKARLEESARTPTQIRSDLAGRGNHTVRRRALLQWVHVSRRFSFHPRISSDVVAVGHSETPAASRTPARAE